MEGLIDFKPFFFVMEDAVSSLDSCVLIVGYSIDISPPSRLII